MFDQTRPEKLKFGGADYRRSRAVVDGQEERGRLQNPWQEKQMLQRKGQQLLINLAANVEYWLESGGRVRKLKGKD